MSSRSSDSREALDMDGALDGFADFTGEVSTLLPHS